MLAIMKNLLILTFALIAPLSVCNAQTSYMQVNKTDGTTDSYDITTIEDVTFSIESEVPDVPGGPDIPDDPGGQGGPDIPDGPGGQGGPGSNITSDAELFNFDVVENYNFLDEEETIDADDDDYVENTKFKATVKVVFDGNTVSYDELPSDVTATIDGAKIVIDAPTDTNIIYDLSGSSSDGMFKIYSDKKFAIQLSGLNLTNTDGPAINIQSKKRSFMVIGEGTENTLADASPYADTGDEDAKGVIFSEGQVIFSGNGRLDIAANCKAGISSDQYLRFRQGNVINVTASEGNAVRGKDSLIVSGGVMNVTVSGNGNKGLKSDGPVYINGGRTTVLNSAVAYYDTDEGELKGAAGIDCGGDLVMTAGSLLLKSTGDGGKGTSVDGGMTIQGGEIRLITTGTKVIYGDDDKSPKGLRCDGDMLIQGGDIMSRTTGGEGSEAIESKGTLTIDGGNVQAYAYDDAINSAGHMYINGGDIWAVSSTNDGMDSNGNMYISGGTIITCGLGEDGVDVIEGGTLEITGGTLFSLGTTLMTTPSSRSTQQSLVVENVTGMSSGTEVSLLSGNTTLFSYTMQFDFSRANMILSVPGLQRGTSYTLKVGNSQQTVRL